MKLRNTGELGDYLQHDDLDLLANNRSALIDRILKLDPNYIDRGQHPINPLLELRRRAYGGQKQNPQGISNKPGFRDIYGYINSEKERLAAKPQNFYKGKEVADISPLTKKAIKIREDLVNNISPYSQNINKLLERENNGLSKENKQNISNSINDNNKFADKGYKFLKDSFNDPQAINKDRFYKKNQKDITKNKIGFNLDIENISNEIKNDQSMSVGQKIKLLRKLGDDENKDKNILADTLSKFGDQDHARQNMQIEADKYFFNKKETDDVGDLKNLEESIEPNRQYAEKLNVQNIEEKRHKLARDAAYKTGEVDIGAYEKPYINPSSPAEGNINVSLDAYGVAPLHKWNQANPYHVPPQPKVNNKEYDYPRVADIQGTLLPNSYQKIQEEDNTDDNKRKDLLNYVTNDNQSADRITNQALAQTNSLLPMEEKKIRQELKERINGIHHKYTQLGQVGSDLHRGEASNLYRILNQKLLSLNSNNIGNRLNQNRAFEANNEKDKLNKLNEFSNQKSTMLNQNVHIADDLNKRGMHQFNAKQSDLERQHHNKVRAEYYKWPNLRNNAVYDNIDDKGLNRDNYEYQE